MPVYNGDGVPPNPYWQSRQRAASSTESSAGEGPSRQRRVSAARSRRIRAWKVFALFWAVAFAFAYFWPSLTGFLDRRSDTGPVPAQAERLSEEGARETPAETTSSTGIPSRHEPGSKGAMSASATKVVSGKGPHDEVDESLEEIMSQIQTAARGGNWVFAAQKAWQLVCRRGSRSDRILLGFLLINARQYKKAIAVLELLVESNEADAEVFHRLGHAYSTVRFHEKALESFLRAMAEEPQNPRHYKCGAKLIMTAFERGDSRFRGRLDLARAWVARARRLGGSDHELARLKGDLAVYMN